MKDVVDSLSVVQKGFVVKYGFVNLLDISNFHVPLPLLEWVMNHMITGVAEFKHKNKCFKLTRSIVKEGLGIPSGHIPIDLSAPIGGNLLHAVSEVRGQYVHAGKSPINRAIALLYAEEEEAYFMRSFMLVALSTVLCPSTQNNVNFKYLSFLMDPVKIKEYDWVGHVVQYMMGEIRKFQGVMDSSDPCDAVIYVGSCLPLLAIVYMDFLDLNQDILSDHHISYAVPRICHIKTSDFLFLQKVDHYRSGLGQRAYGVIPFRDITSTPYASASSDPTQHNSVPRSVVPPSAVVSVPGTLPFLLKMVHLICMPTLQFLPIIHLLLIPLGLLLSMMVLLLRILVLVLILTLPLSRSLIILMLFLSIMKLLQMLLRDLVPVPLRKEKEEKVLLIVKIKIDPSVEDMYQKYVMRKFIKCRKDAMLPIFVSISGFECSYSAFQGSLKPGDQVWDHIMSIYVHLVNCDYKNKLSVGPKYFFPESVEPEITRSHADFNFLKADLFLFPMQLNDQWILVCLNTLFLRIDLFDPANVLQRSLKTDVLNSLMYNFERTCREANIFSRDFASYKVVQHKCPSSLSKFVANALLGWQSFE